MVGLLFFFSRSRLRWLIEAGFASMIFVKAGGGGGGRGFIYGRSDAAETVHGF